jgi:hypothetical protein
MPVAKHKAEYASNCCLEEILSAWDFIKGFYRYDCLLAFKTIFLFRILPISSLGFVL